MALIYCQGDSPLADAAAKEAAEVLVAAYPNHSWSVEVRQGLLIIKHGEASGYRGRIGMARHLAQLGNDANHRKKEVIRAAGELLERANLKRGGRTEDPVRHLEVDKHLRKHWHVPMHLRIIH